MDSRERIYTVLKKHEPADRVPWMFNFGSARGMHPELARKYKQYAGFTEPVYEHFDSDVVCIFSPENDDNDMRISGGLTFNSNGIDPTKYFDEKLLSNKNGYLDPWGNFVTPWERDPFLVHNHAPLSEADSLEEFESYPFPTINEESLRLAKLEADAIRAKGKMSVIHSGSVFEQCWLIRGHQEFLMDMCAEPMFVEALVERVTEWNLELVRKLAAIGVDIFACYDDLGAQRSLQMSPDFYRKYIKPAWKRIWDEIKRLRPDAIIFQHSCGCIQDIIPDMIEIGLDALHPIQPETMDVYKIAENYQKDIAIWGTVSAQKTMPCGTPEDVDNEIRERMERIGKKGSFLLSPANTLGSEVPMENVQAFADAARKYSV